MIIPIPTELAIPSEIAFLVLSFVTILGAILALQAKEIIYGVVSLGASFIGVAGMFALLNAPYLAMLQIAVYIGAVIVLMLFTIMLVRRETSDPVDERLEPADTLSRAGLWAAGLVALLVSGVALIAQNPAFLERAEFDIPIQQLGLALMNYQAGLILLAFVMSATLLGALVLAKLEDGD
jgi:NADH-quinone oxidoreductase subunit J